MSLGADLLAKVKKLLSFDLSLRSHKRRADDTVNGGEDSHRDSKYRRLDESSNIRSIEDYVPRRRPIEPLFRRFQTSNNPNNPTAMGLIQSKKNDTKEFESQQFENEFKQQQKRQQHNLKENNKFQRNNHMNEYIEFSDEDDEVTFVQYHRKPVTKSLMSVQSGQQNSQDRSKFKQVPGLIKPTIGAISAGTSKTSGLSKRPKFTRIPDLHPIATKPLYNNKMILLNGSSGGPSSLSSTKPNTVLMNGTTSMKSPNSSSFRHFDDCTTSFSLRKNLNETKQQPMSKFRKISTLNSIVPKQYILKDRDDYAELLRKVVPGYDAEWSDTSVQKHTSKAKTNQTSDYRLPKSQVRTGIDEIIKLDDDDDDDTTPIAKSPKTKRTEAQILNDIRKQNNFDNDDDDVLIVDPVNTLRPKVETKPEFQDEWLDKLNERYTGLKLQRNNEIKRERKRVEELKAQTKNHEKSYQSRMVSDWMLNEITVITDEEEEEEINDYAAFTEEQQMIIQRAMGGNPNEGLIEKFNMRISRHDIDTLRWNGQNSNWLNDEVINFYMELITERSKLRSADGYPKVHAMNTFFIPRLLQGGYSAVRRWTRKIDLFSVDVIPVPVHVGRIHWCMAIIHMKNKTIKYYDSMGAPNHQVIKALEVYLKEESMDKRKKPFDTSDWHMESVKDVPRQENTCDCGVFSCMFAEFITRNRPISLINQQYMTYCRQRMVLEICTGKMLL